MAPVPPDVVVRILYVKVVVPVNAPNVVSALVMVVVASTAVKDASGATVTPRVVVSAPKAVCAIARAAAAIVRSILRFICSFSFSV
jgi:hypothetical protein